jgi:two-component system cell cycle response regulator
LGSTGVSRLAGVRLSATANLFRGLENALSPAPRILVVDDQPDLRLLIRLTFEGQGYEVDEAPNGEAALEACASRLPDIVLLDVMMPGIDGYEVCRRLKADPRTGRVLAVLMTAGHQETERVRAREAGADLYLAKPFSPAQLLALVRSHLATGRA